MADTLDYWQVKEAFGDLLLQPESSRLDYLDQLQATQPDLANALRARLKRWCEAEHQADSESGHQMIAGYTVLSSIGAGGMGQVWRVRRDDRPDQQLALKQLHTGASDPFLLRRFDLERRLLERLNHPLIVPLIDAGVDQAGRPFIVTPWVDGMRIDHWCAAQHSTVAERIRLISDIANAISHAHGQLIVHCDLKPANLLVDRSAQVRVLDFGIARMLDGTTSQSLDQSLMTLRYAAPEQIAGQLVGPACDLYALGVVAYELLSGQSPYPDCDNPAALTHAITSHQTEAPSRKSGSGLLIDADLDAIILKLLRKEPNLRYASAQELINDLTRWTAGDSVHARADERGYLLRRWIRRFRWPIAASLVLLCLSAWFVWRLNQQLDATAVERDRARAVANYFVQLFRSGTPAETADGSVLALTLLDRSAERLNDSANTLPKPTQALLQLASGRVYADLGQVAKAEPLLARALDTLEQATPPPIDDLIDGYRTHAAVLYQLDQVPASLEQSLAAIRLLESVGERDSERYAGMLQNAAIVHYTLGDQSAGDKSLGQALAVLQDHQERMPRAYILLLQNMADAALLEHDTAKALGHVEQAQQALKFLVPDDPDLTLAVHRALLTIRRDAGQDIRDDLPQWLARAEAHYGQRHIETALWFELAGTLALLDSEYGTAARHFDQAERIAAELFDAPGHNYRMRFVRNQLTTRAAIQQHTSQIDPTLNDLIQNHLMRRLELAEPDSSEVRFEQALLAWAACSAKPEPQKAAAFREIHEDLIADPSQEPWHRQIAAHWRCGTGAPAP